MELDKGKDIIAVLHDQYDALKLNYNNLSERELEQIDKIAGEIQYFALEGKKFGGRVKKPSREYMGCFDTHKINKLIFD